MARRMGRRSFLRAAAGTLAVVPELVRSAPARRPNLLFILADDLGYGDLSCYGRPDYETPVLDRLARQGVRMTSAYAAAPVCSPTRCAFHTGRYPQRLEVGLLEPLTMRTPLAGLDPGHPTVASLLRASGYETALVGKWHLGFRTESGPNAHGYDHFFGVKGGAVDYFTHRRAALPGAASRAGERDLWEDLAPIERVGYLTDLLTDRAIELLRRKRSRPLYLSLHYTAPHSPWEGPEDAAIGHEDHGAGPMVEGGSAKIYAAMMRRMDAGIGRVLAALEASGQDRRTLVVFTSDNGGERYSFNWPFSFHKFDLWEGGIRVPAIVRWTGRLPAGKTADAPAITMDWTATLLAAGGASPAPGHPLDGEDLLPALAGARPRRARALFWRTRRQGAARDAAWKYLDDEGTEHLFDLSADPGEKADLRRSRADVFERVRARYLAWNAEMLPRPPA
jgi:arylsulfatase A-like enzyme